MGQTIVVETKKSRRTLTEIGDQRGWCRQRCCERSGYRFGRCPPSNDTDKRILLYKQDAIYFESSKVVQRHRDRKSSVLPAMRREKSTFVTGTSLKNGATGKCSTKNETNLPKVALKKYN